MGGHFITARPVVWLLHREEKQKITQHACKIISQRWELNPRPLAYEASALPLSYVGRLLSSWNPAPHFLGVKCDVCRIASKLKYLFGWLCATGFLPRAYGVCCTYLLTISQCTSDGAYIVGCDDFVFHQAIIA